jgi:hypothetical protein
MESNCAASSRLARILLSAATVIRAGGFLSRDEYDCLHKVIEVRFPEHLAEFVVSIHTGMRLSEQYSCLWSQVDLERRTIELTKTKNGSAGRCI